MSIFEINKNVFAIGTAGKRAKYVIRSSGKKLVGVRGVRPILDNRFEVVKASAAVKTALEARV